MATETLSDLSDALSIVYDSELQKQWNRMAVTASMLPVKAGAGPNASFAVEFSGATANTVAEGSDVDNSEFNSDINVPVTLSWAIYRSAFQLSELEIDAAMTARGSAEALLNILGDRLVGSVAKLASKFNYDCLNADGTDGSSNPTLIGFFQGPLEESGLYGGQSRGTYDEWKGNVLSNGSVARPLTFDLMEQMEQRIFTASGSRPSMIVTSPGVYRKYANLFESARRLATDGRGPLSYEAGAADLFWKGIPLVRDKDMTSGKMLFLNPSAVEVQYLPRRQSPVDAHGKAMTALVGGAGAGASTPVGVPAQVKILAKTGDSVKVSVNLTAAMLVKRPNTCGYISDISET